MTYRLDLFPDPSELGDVEVEKGFERVREMVRACDAQLANAVRRDAAQAIVLQGDIAVRGMTQNGKRICERRPRVLHQPGMRGCHGCLVAVVRPEIEAGRYTPHVIVEAQPTVICRHDRKIETALADGSDGKRDGFDDGVGHAHFGEISSMKIDP